MGGSRSEKEKRKYKRKTYNQEKRSKAIGGKFRQEGCFGSRYRWITRRRKRIIFRKGGEYCKIRNYNCYRNPRKFLEGVLNVLNMFRRSSLLTARGRGPAAGRSTREMKVGHSQLVFSTGV
jgi:hypothetical protein